MGLIEDYSSYTFISTLYITSVGAKDVGNYSCSAVTSDLLNIDEEEAPLQIYVTGSDLTPSTVDQVVLLPYSSPFHIPCIPSHPSVSVTVIASGQNITSLFNYNPRTGFTALSPISFPSFTCYFSFKGQTQSIQLRSTSSIDQSSTARSSFLPVILFLTEDTGDTLELVCKVTSPDVAFIYWTVPAVNSSQLHSEDLAMLYPDKFTIREDLIQGVKIASLVLEDPGEDDQGVYRSVVVMY